VWGGLHRLVRRPLMPLAPAPFVAAASGHPPSLAPSQAITARKAGNGTDELVPLMRLASAMDCIPALQPGCPEIELIASSLQSVSAVEDRAGIYMLAGQVDPAGAEVMARLLGFDPAQVQPQLVALLAQQREEGGQGQA
jgi:hypothetical protein